VQKSRAFELMDISTKISTVERVQAMVNPEDQDARAFDRVCERIKANLSAQRMEIL